MRFIRFTFIIQPNVPAVHIHIHIGPQGPIASQEVGHGGGLVGGGPPWTSQGTITDSQITLTH